MPTLQVFEYPNPILKKISVKVTEFKSQVLQAFINDAIETLNSHKFCVGLAAPQLGNLQRIIFIDVSRGRRTQPGNGLLILINPELLEASNYKIVREGCLSIPDYTANVKRAMNIKVKSQDKYGETKIIETSNFEAHAIQHEMDHLDGILFLDRIANPASELFRRAQS